MRWVYVGVAAIIIVALGFFAFNRFVGNKITSPAVLIENLNPKEIDKIKVINEKVTLTREGNSKDLAKDSQEEIRQGDKVTTDKDGLAAIIYKSGTTVRLKGDSEVIFNSETSLTQNIGTIFVRFKKLLGVQESLNVESENMVATVRGSAFASIIKKGFDPRILVTDDEIEVTARDPKTKEKLEKTKKNVKKGDQAVVSRLNKSVLTAKAILTKEEQDWIALNDAADGLPTPTSTATPAATLKPSGSPIPTKPPLSTISSMPSVGYSRNFVNTPVGGFSLTCIGAKIGSFRTVTDSASDSDCKDNCPVLPLDAYATRNNGFAAMNGMYFCPADYASCAGKTNTFDTLFFNSRTRTYMNSDNNKFSTIPFFVVNADGSPRYVGQTLNWGRDTGIQAGTAGNPMVIQGGSIAVVEANLDDKQRTVKSNRGAIVQKTDTLYLCIVGGATVMDTAQVYKTLGVDNAINIDGGGSSALWVNGSYVYGPGRQIPTAIIFAR